MLIAILALALVAFGVAHVVLAVSLARRHWWQALVGLLVAPLAVYWAWQHGMRRRVYAWGAALVVYTLLLTLA